MREFLGYGPAIAGPLSHLGRRQPPAYRMTRSPTLTHTLAASHNHQHNPADQTKSAQDRREIDPMFFLVRDFNRTELCVLFFGIPTQPTVGKTDDAYDD